MLLFASAPTELSAVLYGLQHLNADSRRNFLVFILVQIGCKTNVPLMHRRGAGLACFQLSSRDAACCGVCSTCNFTELWLVGAAGGVLKEDLTATTPSGIPRKLLVHGRAVSSRGRGRGGRGRGRGGRARGRSLSRLVGFGGSLQSPHDATEATVLCRPAFRADVAQQASPAPQRSIPGQVQFGNPPREQVSGKEQLIAARSLSDSSGKHLQRDGHGRFAAGIVSQRTAISLRNFTGNIGERGRRGRGRGLRGRGVRIPGQGIPQPGAIRVAVDAMLRGRGRRGRISNLVRPSAPRTTAPADVGFREDLQQQGPPATADDTAISRKGNAVVGGLAGTESHDERAQKRRKMGGAVASGAPEDAELQQGTAGAPPLPKRRKRLGGVHGKATKRPKHLENPKGDQLGKAAKGVDMQVEHGNGPSAMPGLDADADDSDFVHSPGWPNSHNLSARADGVKHTGKRKRSSIARDPAKLSSAFGPPSSSKEGGVPESSRPLGHDNAGPSIATSSKGCNALISQRQAPLVGAKLDGCPPTVSMPKDEKPSAERGEAAKRPRGRSKGSGPRKVRHEEALGLNCSVPVKAGLAKMVSSDQKAESIHNREDANASGRHDEAAGNGVSNPGSSSEDEIPLAQLRRVPDAGPAAVATRKQVPVKAKDQNSGGGRVAKRGLNPARNAGLKSRKPATRGKSLHRDEPNGVGAGNSARCTSKLRGGLRKRKA